MSEPAAQQALTAPEPTARFCRDAKWLEDAVAQLLIPFGWSVETFPVCNPAPMGGLAFEYRFELNVTYPASDFRGAKLGHALALSESEWRLRGQESYTRRLPLEWANLVMRCALHTLAHPPMPPAPETDWRPAGAVPEDFYAS